MVAEVNEMGGGDGGVFRWFTAVEVAVAATSSTFE